MNDPGRHADLWDEDPLPVPSTVAPRVRRSQGFLPRRKAHVADSVGEQEERWLKALRDRVIES